MNLLTGASLLALAKSIYYYLSSVCHRGERKAEWRLCFTVIVFKKSTPSIEEIEKEVFSEMTVL